MRRRQWVCVRLGAVVLKQRAWGAVVVLGGRVTGLVIVVVSVGRVTGLVVTARVEVVIATET